MDSTNLDWLYTNQAVSGLITGTHAGSDAVSVNSALSLDKDSYVWLSRRRRKPEVRLNPPYLDTNTHSSYRAARPTSDACASRWQTSQNPSVI